jgi:hypothetical protein
MRGQGSSERGKETELLIQSQEAIGSKGNTLRVLLGSVVNLVLRGPEIVPKD